MNKPIFFKRYWRMLCERSTVSMGIVAAFFFASGIIFWGGFNWTMEVSNTEEFCIGCHEMKDNVYPSYTKSIHYSNRSGVRAVCSDCHVPHEFADKIVRKIQASKEVWGKITGKINTPEKFAAHRLSMAQREWKRFNENDSLECRNCHDQAFMNFDKQGAPGTFMHGEMITTGKFTCINCHKGIAHKLPEIENLDQISASTLEPTMRPPYDHSKSTLESN
ncbi:MAG: NapC/NirT family cytochrome c [Photobacterium frigidiphilum]|uniref:NapC/NirT family cytochrome c n=1 Tax=Photobacterium frigidiphilum TaxID=264736 RepID=UPI003001651E